MSSRYTCEEAVEEIGSRYDLILVASRRARELNRGWQPLTATSNGPVITALTEIQKGLIGRDYLRKPQNLDRRERPPEQ
jgi:DNA-directed RNA polymerase subunit omega